MKHINACAIHDFSFQIIWINYIFKNQLHPRRCCVRTRVLLIFERIDRRSDVYCQQVNERHSQRWQCLLAGNFCVEGVAFRTVQCELHNVKGKDVQKERNEEGTNKWNSPQTRFVTMYTIYSHLHDFESQKTACAFVNGIYEIIYFLHTIWSWWTVLRALQVINISSLCIRVLYRYVVGKAIGNG